MLKKEKNIYDESEVLRMWQAGNVFTRVFKAANIFEEKSRAVIYERTGRGMIFSMQFIGAVNTTISDTAIWWKGYERTIVSVTTDGHTFFRGRLYEFLGMNTDIASIEEYPRNGFYTPLFIKGGKFSGITLNFKIPYYENVKVELIRAEEDTGEKMFSWITIKDTDVIHISYGGITIPYGAYLHSEKVIQTVASGDEVILFSSEQNGMVLSVSLFGKSTRFNFVEGCIRTYIRGNDREPMLLSSGFEDYFGFCFGFNLGVQQFPMFGVTLHEMLETSVRPFRVSAYKNHIDEPLTFVKGGFKMTVRNGDQNTGKMDLRTAVDMAEDGTGTAMATMGGQITYYTWDESDSKAFL